jgi:hypothetical protein
MGYGTGGGGAAAAIGMNGGREGWDAPVLRGHEMRVVPSLVCIVGSSAHKLHTWAANMDRQRTDHEQMSDNSRNMCTMQWKLGTAVVIRHVRCQGHTHTPKGDRPVTSWRQTASDGVR